MIRLVAPFAGNQAADSLSELNAGDRVSLSGIIYTARDAAHKKMIELLSRGERLPFDPNGAVIYYAGPTPPRPDGTLGSIGPTTASRIDSYTPALLTAGIRGMIGKGNRSPAVIEAMIGVKACYFAAVGGAGALLARKVKSYRVIAWPELGAEAIYELVVEEFPLTVAIDSRGNNLFVDGPAEHRQ